MVDNIIDTARLSGGDYNLQMRPISFSSLILKHINICKKIHLDFGVVDFKQNFVIDLDLLDPLIMECSSYYIGRVIDNILFYILHYSNSGDIVIQAKKIDKNSVEFVCMNKSDSISDTNTYWNPNSYIFSKNEENIGIRLYEKIISLHKGKFLSPKLKDRALSFSFILPMKHTITLAK